jgi:DNA transposition AAA+ family ATPase
MDQELTREEIGAVLRRHRGSMTQIAKDLGIDAVNISQYLMGLSRSKRVAAASEAKAAELLAVEAQEAAVEPMSARAAVLAVRKAA